VIGDPTRLRQILLNLLTNALKFTHRGRVTVTVECVCASGAERLGFAVTDTGIGIPPERQARLFEEFSQADASTTRQYGGTGLGLAICQRLVKAMDGTIGVASAAGQGSTFWFTLPLPATSEPPINPTAVTRGAPLRVLVVDDNIVNQMVVSAMLERDGHSVVTAADGAEAVAVAQAERFDVVLMDMQMPVMNGEDAARAIRRLPEPAGSVPIVALTANAMVDEVQRCYAAGMNDHVSKPIDRSRLRSVLVTFANAIESGGNSVPSITAE
jgi:CheY-like chemotaxis protein